MQFLRTDFLYMCNFSVVEREKETHMEKVQYIQYVHILDH
jgi:hypothetical protein